MKIANQAVDAKTAHMARQQAAAMLKPIRKPHGNYSHDTLMLGQVYAVHGWTIDGLPPSVDIHPNGAQNLTDVSDIALMKSIQYLESYWPVVGDVVVMLTQPFGRSRTLRYVLGAVDGSASPYPRPLGHIDSVGRWVQGPGSLWGGPGAPTIPLADPTASPPIQGAVNGDWYLQFDEPLAWAMISGTWLPSTGLAATSTQAGTGYTLQPTDSSTVIEFTNASGCLVSVPEGYFPVGTVIEFIRQGGPVSVNPASPGVTLQSPGGLAIANQYGTMTLRQVAVGVWQLSGDVTPAKQVTTLTADYVATVDDMGSLFVMDSTASLVVILTSTYPYPIGAWVDICQLSSGTAAVEADGVTLLSPTGAYSTRVQYSTIRATQIATNEWLLSGDLS